MIATPEPTAEDLRAELLMLREMVQSLASALAWTTARIRCLEQGEPVHDEYRSDRERAMRGCEELLRTAKALK